MNSKNYHFPDASAYISSSRMIKDKIYTYTPHGEHKIVEFLPVLSSIITHNLSVFLSAKQNPEADSIRHIELEEQECKLHRVRDNRT